MIEADSEGIGDWSSYGAPEIWPQGGLVREGYEEGTIGRKPKMEDINPESGMVMHT